jgi:hypothetical protein
MKVEAENIKRLAWLLAPLLVLVIVLTILLTDFVREAIVVPISYILWLGNLVLKSISQILLWAWLPVIAFFIALRSLSTAKKDKPIGIVSEAETRYPRRQRVDFWVIQIHQNHGYFGRTRFAEHLGRLILDILAYQERITPWEIEQRIENGDLEVPPEVRSYLHEKRRRYSEGSGGLYQRLRRWLKNAVTILIKGRSSVRPASHHPDLETVVAFLEKQLEVEYDHYTP